MKKTSIAKAVLKNQWSGFASFLWIGTVLAMGIKAVPLTLENSLFLTFGLPLAAGVIASLFFVASVCEKEPEMRKISAFWIAGCIGSVAVTLVSALS